MNFQGNHLVESELELIVELADANERLLDLLIGKSLAVDGVLESLFDHV